jgi:CO dehydrogenase maturation factor
MTLSIAVAGKGGSGKTSTASLIIRYLMHRGMTPVLAVDADGNANLGESLGLELEDTIGSVIADFNEDKISIPSGLTKGAYLELKLNQTIVESRGLDLISMGRGEGTGCYCYPNTVLKKFIDELKGNYAAMVMDNEAGMEHLSRRTTEDIDELLIVSDHSVKGARTVGRMQELAQFGVQPLATIPLDEQIARSDLERKSLLELPDDSVSVAAVAEMMDIIVERNKKVTQRG